MKLHVDGTDTLNMRRWEEKLVPGVAAMGRSAGLMSCFLHLRFSSDTLVSESNKLFISQCKLKSGAE